MFCQRFASSNCSSAFVPKCGLRNAGALVTSIGFVTGLVLTENHTFNNFEHDCAKLRSHLINVIILTLFISNVVCIAAA